MFRGGPHGYGHGYGGPPGRGGPHGGFPGGGHVGFHGGPPGGGYGGGNSAVSEVVRVGLPLAYDDVLELREISSSLVRHDLTEPTSVDIALAGLKALATWTAGAKATGAPLRKSIDNFYQTNPT